MNYVECIEYGKHDALPIKYTKSYLCVYYNSGLGYYLLSKLSIYYNEQLRCLR